MNRACSAGVSAKSSTTESATQALGGGQLETAEGVIKVRHVVSGVRFGQSMRSTPEGRIRVGPRLLITRQNDFQARRDVGT